MVDASGASDGGAGSLAERTAQRYVDCVNLGDFDAVGDLFAEDATHHPPPPATGAIHGREAIRAFYKAFAAPLRATIIPLRFVADARQCVLEFEATVPEHPHLRNPSMEIFSVDDDGLIVRMAIYRREIGV